METDLGGVGGGGELSLARLSFRFFLCLLSATAAQARLVLQ